MTDKEAKSANLHHLREVSPRVKEKTEGIEKSIQDISMRLSTLEKEIHDNVLHLKRELKDKKSSDPEKTAAIQKEINQLKADFESQLEKIGTTLKKNQNSLSSVSLAPWKLLKKLIFSVGFFDKDRSSKEFHAIWDKEIDPFGRDPAFEEKVKPLFDFLYYNYWRIKTYGLENIPQKGRSLLVVNHSGTLPYDGAMLRLAVSNDHPAQRDVRFLVEDFVYYLPFIGTYMYRLGGVRASSDNAERLLNTDHLVAVFPEGVKGIGKYYAQRYHLQRFGRGGFIRLALKTDSPIIPVAIIGAEEIAPILYKSSVLAKPLGIPYLPITPTFPLLGPLGLLPLPSKWSIYFGKPIDLRPYGRKCLEDDLKIHQLSEMVRHTIQEMIGEGLKRRRSVWFG